MDDIFNGQNVAMDTLSVILIIILVVWCILWKGIALWRAAKNNQLGWYVVLLFVNTLGILEIIYLTFYANKRDPKA